MKINTYILSPNDERISINNKDSESLNTLINEICLQLDDDKIYGRRFSPGEYALIRVVYFQPDLVFMWIKQDGDKIILSLDRLFNNKNKVPDRIMVLSDPDTSLELIVDNITDMWNSTTVRG